MSHMFLNIIVAILFVAAIIGVTAYYWNGDKKEKKVKKNQSMEKNKK